jgi:hypothetical protein
LLITLSADCLAQNTRNLKVVGEGKKKDVKINKSEATKAQIIIHNSVHI